MRCLVLFSLTSLLAPAATITSLSTAIDLIGGLFSNIANVIRLVVALVTGDWAGAWNA